jgi:hypothetical protein
MQPIGTFALTNDSYEIYSTKYRQTWSALNDVMPINIHLLTFDQLGPEQYLIRIEHFFEKNEDEVLSKPVQVDLQKLFYSQGQIIDLIELTLNANLPLNDIKRLNWTTTENQSSHWNENSKSCFSFRFIIFSIDLIDRTSLKDTIITLNPMQIRTFQVSVQKSSR